LGPTRFLPPFLIEPAHTPFSLFAHSTPPAPPLSHAVSTPDPPFLRKWQHTGPIFLLYFGARHRRAVGSGDRPPHLLSTPNASSHRCPPPGPCPWRTSESPANQLFLTWWTGPSRTFTVDSPPSVSPLFALFSLKKLCDITNPVDLSPLIAGDRCHRSPRCRPTCRSGRRGQPLWDLPHPTFFDYKLKRVPEKLTCRTGEHHATTMSFTVVGGRPIIAPPPQWVPAVVKLPSVLPAPHWHSNHHHFCT
jgi:hypothetical protein